MRQGIIPDTADRKLAEVEQSRAERAGDIALWFCMHKLCRAAFVLFCTPQTEEEILCLDDWHYLQLGKQPD